MKDQIVLVGNSNAGKSSLVRLLVGRGGKPAAGRSGKAPGTTRKPVVHEVPSGRLGGVARVVDTPGLGYFSSTSKRRAEETRRSLVRYLEENAGSFAAGVVVVSLPSFVRNVTKWEATQVPLDVEFVEFFEELGVRPFVVANKVDKIPRARLEWHLDFVRDKVASRRNARWDVPIVGVSLKFRRNARELLERLREFVGSRPVHSH
ncbi:MAG: hypothetical protein Kow0069_31650 [Promethearchaeota archaeon]